MSKRTNVSIGFRLSADGSQLIGQTRVSREELRKLGVEFSTSGNKAQGYTRHARDAEGATDQLGRGLSRARGFLAAFGVSLSAIGMQRLITGVTSAADEIVKLSARTGIATDDLQRLRFASEQSGVQFNQMTDAVRFLQRQMVDNEQVSQFVNALDIRELGTVDQLTAIADAFASIQSPAERTAAAARLFGRSAGPELLSFLELGSSGIQDLTERADKLGLVLSGDLLQAGTQFSDTMDVLQKTLWASVQSGVLRALVDDTGKLKQEIVDLVDTLTSPEFQDGVGRLVSGFARITGVIATTLNVMGFLKDEVRAVFGSIDDDDRIRLEDSLAGVTDRIERVRAQLERVTTAGYDGPGGITETQERLDDLIEKQDILMLRLRQLDAQWADTGRTSDEALEISITKGAEAAEAVRKLFREQQEARGARQEMDRFVASFGNLRGQLDPTWRATQEYTQQVGLLHRAWEMGLITQEEYADLLWVIEGRMEDVANTTEAASEKMERAADPFVVAWQRAVERIDDLFVDLWASAFSGFSDFAEQMKQAFRRLLGEMAHAAITRPIVVSIGTAMGAGASAGVGAMGGIGGLTSGIGSGISAVGSALGSGVVSGIGAGMGLAGTNIGAFGYFGSMGANLSLAGSSFSSGAIGTGLGAIAPYALPALGLLALSGVFGGKPSNKAAMSDIDLATGGLIGLDQMTGDKAPAQETLQARDALTEAIMRAVGGITSMGGSATGRLRLDIGERDGVQVDLGDGLMHMGEDVNDALGNIVDLLLERSEGLDEAFAGLIRGIEGGEGRVRMTTALGMIQGLRGGDSVGMGREAIAARDMTLTASFREQTQAVGQLIRTYDGSLEATEALAEAYATQRAMAVELAVVLEDSARAISAMFGDTALRIRESLMGEQELYEFRRSRTHDLIDQLAVADDAQQIQTLSREIDQLVNTLWGSLDDVQRTILGPEFLQAIEGSDRLAQERLGVIRDEITAADTHLTDSAQRALEAASLQVQASQTMQEAALTISRAAPVIASAAETFSSAASRMRTGGEVHTR